jgi:hypothetical protein
LISCIRECEVKLVLRLKRQFRGERPLNISETAQTICSARAQNMNIAAICRNKDEIT